MTVTEKAALAFALILPAIPAAFVVLSFTGFSDVSLLSPDDSAFTGMNPLAAIGWGIGVYLAELTVLLLLGILFQRRKKPEK